MTQENLQQALVDFVYHENLLLDEQRYPEWYELFAEDGVYWVPLHEQQTEKELHASIALEDRMLLKLRIDRMQHAHAHSLHPRVRGLHVVQQPRVLPDMANGLAAVSCQLMYIERQADKQVLLGASVRYGLRRVEGALRIVEKRIVLLGCDSYLPAIQLFI
ncbi:aromatic-ring-hydroxylating dioxygenase subunit beta [Pusillimonas sp. CC-YST705]|uniref:Aromatic-ring-hydroxylating dioxygenase subunit beta n=1 Tax=Mesopusillimonas faecipullorum TaxID=2755040 RepID=A0ABS8C9F8_9BURK|nr:aromatic-ring-hydroxylating dioxygenase subunit beta [Mesopusillimonas faecipullorum]MCB5362477.1 aromatic-ring-hydroxylating dioxygenase subunit beta [Mesopusillimonas faecipullorum]